MVFSIAARAAEPGVAVPPPGSVFAHWSYTFEQLEAMVPKARPEDVATPEAIVRALHESVNGPKGRWNSDRFRSLFLPNALLAEVTKNEQGKVVISNRPLDIFLKDVQDLHNASGWYETVTKMQISKTAKHDGALAAVYYHGGASTTPGGKPVEDDDSMGLLMYDGKRWWVLSDTW